MNRSNAIPTTLRGMLLAALAVIAAPGAMAAAAGNALQSVDVQPLGTQGVQLVLTTSGPAPQPNSFSIENPATISLDLAGTSLALPQRRIDVGSNGLNSVLAAEADGRTRIVLNLERMMAFAPRVEGNRIIVILGEAAGTAAVAAAAPAAASAAAPRLGRGIQNIDFRRASDGSSTGRIIVRLGDPRTPVNLRQQGNQILVDFVGADLPPNLRRRFDVTDFATPVVAFDAVSTPNGAQLIINSSGDFEQLAYQADDQYVIEVQTRRAPRAAEAERQAYTGERMTATFQDIPARTLLQLIGQTGGRNMVINDSVSGNVTLSLENVPWDHALDLVLRLKGLDKRVEDNVILVGPIAELAARDKAELSARQEIQELAPLRSELVQVNFAKAGDIAGLISSQRAGESASTLLSSRGRITVYAPSNALLIQDTAESIAAIRELVGQLDIPVRQVQIEARIVAVSEDFTRDLGVRFGATGIETTSDGFISSTGSAISNEDILGTGGAPFPGGAPFAPSRYNVNLPAPSPAGSIAFMVLGSDYLLDLELSAAQSEGQGEVISQPSITVSNQQEALIAQGSEIPYQEAASSGATSVSFKDVKTSLTVTPLITPDNRLILDIAVQKQRVGDLVVGIGGGQIPSIQSSEMKTQVVVSDGQTVVLGGILETERRETVKKVPLLGDVPIFGHLFKSTSRVNNKDELLIFVTPRIIREDGVR